MASSSMKSIVLFLFLVITTLSSPMVNATNRLSHNVNAYGFQASSGNLINDDGSCGLCEACCGPCIIDFGAPRCQNCCVPITKP
ncbi:hypothetical protein L6164_007487 [Bauhinia variegata]|uniref:Uncharacterized protein n=1 Tax=Bauhinia variegata TaxID=167791 RepID=A0ACB9PDK3_BAUVA|nr:hypothetical protein L6164_007487 [Bauhinia variegata]